MGYSVVCRICAIYKDAFLTTSAYITMQFKQYRGNWNMRLRYLVSIPFIYGMIVPIVFLDVCLEVYHRVAFWLYKIPYVSRKRYIRIDRHKLSYLRWYEKLSCVYCGYANGLFPYAAAIAAETEKYWCGIKHKEDGVFVSPPHHADFLPYGDVEALEQRYPRRS